MGKNEETHKHTRARDYINDLKVEPVNQQKTLFYLSFRGINHQ